MHVEIAAESQGGIQLGPQLRELVPREFAGGRAGLEERRNAPRRVAGQLRCAEIRQRCPRGDGVLRLRDGLVEDVQPLGRERTELVIRRSHRAAHKLLVEIANAQVAEQWQPALSRR